jgi:hypothetical protein
MAGKTGGNRKEKEVSSERDQGVRTQRMNLQRGEDIGLLLVVMINSCKSPDAGCVQPRLIPDIALGGNMSRRC